MIYFLQPVSGGPVKIGTTENLELRQRQLETHYRMPLALLATMPGGREEEAELHERFGHLRIGRTEQFRPAPELMEFIGRPLLVGANPDAVEKMGRDDSAVKIDAGIISKAKMIAAARRITVAEYLSDLLKAPVDRDFAKEMRRVEQEGGAE